MNRQIKFRIWNTNNYEMYDNVIRIDFYNDGNIIVEAIGGEDKYRRCIVQLNECVLMQSVGFKDKNGKDIYEGDIDKFGYTISYIANTNEGLGMQAGYYSERDNFESFSPLECEEDVEIIGNIYENPELKI